jgi:hypothetical protein
MRDCYLYLTSVLALTLLVACSGAPSEPAAQTIVTFLMLPLAGNPDRSADLEWNMVSMWLPTDISARRYLTSWKIMWTSRRRCLKRKPLLKPVSPEGVV